MQKKITTGLFRLTMAIALLGLVFSQVVAPAEAQGGQPPRQEGKVQLEADLGDVETYFGRLGDIKGPINVVVEMRGMPAILAFAESGSAAATAQAAENSDAQADFMSTLAAQGIQATELYRTQKAYNGIWMRVDPKDLKAIASMRGVLAIHPVIPKTIDHTTSVPLIGALQAWAGSGEYQGQNIKVGIIDTGVDYIHTNFGGPGVYDTQDFTTLGEAGNLFPTAKVVGGWDFAGDDYDARYLDTSFPVPDPDPMDCNGHGSHVAGTAAGLGVNPDGTTFTGDYAALAALTPAEYMANFRIGPGVAPKAEIYALRVFGCAGSTDLTEQAIEWAMDPNGDNDMSDHLDVINMSLGSSFGSRNDSSAVAANNAAQAGILVVISAGNSSDVYYITGSPSVAKGAISVANSVDSGAVFGAFELVSTAGSMTLGTYAATEAAFGPELDETGVTGVLMKTTPTNGCAAIAEDLTGKIALIDRGSCTFKTKVYQAMLKGAAGVLIANNAAGFPLTMGNDALIPDVTIPSMMTTLDVGNALKADMVSGNVTVRLTSEFRDTFVVSNPAIEDTLVSSSSRGPARNGAMLKPDLAAPGDTIYSTATGTGNMGVSFGGTSMAAPHVAGIMAILRQQHPDWSVAELKALVMNTATNDLFVGQNKTGNKYTPTRIGTGRASVPNATSSSVVAYNKTDPSQVSVSFGEVAVVNTQNFARTIQVSNKGTLDESYNVTFDSRYQANPGLTFTVLNGNGGTLVNPVLIPAGGSVTLYVKVDANPALLSRARDATIATTNSRQRFSEGGGYVTFTSTGASPTLRVSVHIAARPASAMRVEETNVALNDALGTLSLHPTGTAVDTADDTSLVSILELKAESPNDDWSTGSNDAADLRYVGAASNYPYAAFGSSRMYFGIATYGKWDTLNATEFDVYIDIDEDGIEDYVVFNATLGFFTGTTDDVMLTSYCSLSEGWCDYWDYVNNFGAGTLNTNLYNNNVLTLSLPLTEFGLKDGVNTDFNFYVATFNREAAGAVDVTDWMSYDVAKQPFLTTEGVYFGRDMWYDLPGEYPTYNIGYNMDALLAFQSKGLLLLHHHNAINTAEVVRVTLPPTVVSIKRLSADPVLTTAPVAFEVKFTSPVTGVDASDFLLVKTGSLPNAGITSVTGSGDTYTVTVNVGANDGGTLRLDVADDDTIVDANSTPLGGMSTGNGDFTTGESYFVVQYFTATFRSLGAQDGWVLESTERSNVGGSLNVLATTTNVGDDAQNRQYRSIFSFDTSALPDSAVITNATLSVLRSGLVGTNPFTNLGNLTFDIRMGSFLTPGLAIGDFQAPADQAAAGNFAKVPVNGWHSGNIKPLAFQFVNVAGTTQFRVRFVTDDNNNLVADYLKLFSGNAGEASRPKLVVRYYVLP